MANAVQKVTFHFDPACPWTWRTHQWLLDVTSRNQISVEYRSFELSNGAPIDAVPEQYRASAAASREFLRGLEKAHADRRDDIVGEAYTAYGTLLHEQGQSPSSQLVQQAFAEHGGADYVHALSDDSLDAVVAASRARAEEFSGDDTGSPVLILTAGSGDRGFFGPVVAPAPKGADADRLWEAVATAATLQGFFELKARRTTSP